MKWVSTVAVMMALVAIILMADMADARRTCIMTGSGTYGDGLKWYCADD